MDGSCRVPLDPAPNLVHYLPSHMAGHGVGGRSSLLSTFDRHKEVAQARIQDEAYVVALTQRILPDLEIISRDLVVALTLQEEH